MAKRNYDSWSKEELVREVEKLEKKLKKSYGLVWEDKLEDVATLCKEKLPVLEEDKSKEIATDNNKPTNILIEGDNYHALSVLNYTHKGKIDVIYIDPPYNTGNKDFKYNDRWVDSEDAYKHSMWLSFMKKRLVLAKPLVKNTGIILISMDDNGIAQLKLLCDEIFGIDNFVANFVWKRRSGANDPKNLVSTDHEYVLCYKRSQYASFFGIEKDLSNYKNPDNDSRGPWTAGDLTCGKTKDERPNLFYNIADPITKKVYKANPNRVWRFEKERMLKEISDGKVLFPKKEGGVPQYKRFAKDLKSNYKPLSTWIEASIINKKDIQSEVEEYEIRVMQSDLNQAATKELRDIFKQHSFTYPKPKKLIKEFVKYSSKEEAIILDFMAGSGTTGHAVLELNEEDNGSRKFILCTNNENDICTDVCYPRIKKLINGYTDSSDERVKGLGGNLKYFKTEFVDAEPMDRNKKKLVDKSTEMLCLKEDCFDPIKKDQHFRIFKNNQNKYLGIIYDDDGIEPFKKEAKRIKNKFVVYVFSLDESAREEEFEDMVNMVQLKPIPAVILNVYKRIFK